MTSATASDSALRVDEDDRDPLPRNGFLNHNPEAIRWVMRVQDVSASELAGTLGLSRSYLSMALAGLRNVRPTVIDDMADALGCPPSMLAAGRLDEAA